MRKLLSRAGFMASLSAVLSACAVFSQGVPPPPMTGGYRPVAAGTGFFVARDRVLTNYHVVKDCKALTMGNNIEGWEVDAQFLAGDERADLALLSARASGIRPARFRTRANEGAGDGWAIVGYPDNAFPILQAELDRVTLDPADIFSDKRTMAFSGEVRHGNSGSPVLDNRGAVVGVVFGKIDSEKLYLSMGIRLDNIGVAIPGRTVLDFLRKNEVSVRSAASRGRPGDKELLDEARNYVRQVTCWQ